MPPTDPNQDRTEVDLDGVRRIHIVGVGGSGMRAIASVLATMGHQVTGSDAADSVVLDRLRNEGVDAWVGHRPEAMAQTDLVAASTAVPASDPELSAARSHGVPVLTRAQLLAGLTRRKATLAVAGTHGKTTTSSLLAHILLTAGVDPSFIIGAELASTGSGARWGGGDWFVVEADESDSTFLELDRRQSIITNIEADHLAHHGTFEALVGAFDRFAEETPDGVVVCADDAEAAALAARCQATTYGVVDNANYRILDVEATRSGTNFSVSIDGDTAVVVRLPMPGLHNVHNATAAFAVAHRIGIEPTVVASALSTFAGVARRFEHRGDANGITYIDDYAHLPTEVSAAIDAAMEGPWDRVVCSFQPHRYTRTAELWQDFTDAFQRVDQLVLCGIYTAGEAPIDGVTGALLAQAVAKGHPDLALTYLETLDEVEDHLAQTLRPGDLCLTLGAGDLTTMADRLLRREPAPGASP